MAWCILRITVICITGTRTSFYSICFTCTHQSSKLSHIHKYNCRTKAYAHTKQNCRSLRHLHNRRLRTLIFSKRNKKIEGLKREMKMLETVELQILGVLLKIKGARCNEGQTDLETVARKCKAFCKSIKVKLEVLEKELNDLNHPKEKINN